MWTKYENDFLFYPYTSSTNNLIHQLSVQLIQLNLLLFPDIICTFPIYQMTLLILWTSSSVIIQKDQHKKVNFCTPTLLRKDCFNKNRKLLRGVYWTKILRKEKPNDTSGVSHSVEQRHMDSKKSRWKIWMEIWVWRIIKGVKWDDKVKMWRYWKDSWL